MHIQNCSSKSLLISLILHFICQNFEICYLNVTSIMSSWLLLSYQIYRVIIMGFFLFVCFWTFCFALSFSFFVFFFFSFSTLVFDLLFSQEQATTTDCSPAFWGRLPSHVVKCHLFTQKAHYSVSFTSITDLSACLPGICILEGHIALSIPCTIVNQEMCVLLLGLCSLSFAFTGRF